MSNEFEYEFQKPFPDSTRSLALPFLIHLIKPYSSSANRVPSVVLFANFKGPLEIERLSLFAKLKRGDLPRSGQISPLAVWPLRVNWQWVALY